MKLATKITRVVMYPNQAKLTREATFYLEPGNHRLTLENLPPDLIPESIRIQLHSEQGVILMGMDLEKIHLREAPAEKINRLQKDIEDLQDNITLIHQKKETLRERITHLDGLLKSPRSYAYGLASGKIDFASHTTWLETLSAQRNALLEESLEMDRGLREKQKNLKQAQASLSDLADPEKKALWLLHCDLHSPKESEVRIELIYDTPQAGWQPLYDFRLNQDQLHVDINADVIQTTGEDWQDVQMILSTAQPEEQANLIDLAPWYVNFRPVRPFRTASREPMAKMVLTADAASAPAPVAYEPAIVEDQGTHVTYQVQQAVTINSGVNPHKIQVAGFDLQVEIDLQVAPRYQTAVVRRVKTQNTSKFVLLPGEVQLFDGNTFIGGTMIDLVPKGAEIKMPFGYDPRISVTWELVQRDVEKQFLQDRRRIRYSYQAVLTSHIPHPIKAHVYDHLPVARAEEINIKIKDLVPKPDVQDDLHRLTWHLELKPEEETIIQIAFTVDYPRDKELQGLA